jgi:hypothetical protein
VRLGYSHKCAWAIMRIFLLLLIVGITHAFQNLPMRGKLRPLSPFSEEVRTQIGITGGPPLWHKSHGQRALLNVHWGIPKLFRWLVDLYPIVLDSVGDGLTSDKASSVDNFYLDMNGNYPHLHTQ